jgi:hypothetical protein
VLDSLPQRPSDTQAYVIGDEALGSTDIPKQKYWYHIFSNACALGPRMVGALLLCAPPAALYGAKNAIVELFLKLEAWR